MTERAAPSLERRRTYGTALESAVEALRGAPEAGTPESTATVLRAMAADFRLFVLDLELAGAMIDEANAADVDAALVDRLRQSSQRLQAGALFGFIDWMEKVQKQLAEVVSAGLTSGASTAPNEESPQ